MRSPSRSRWRWRSPRSSRTRVPLRVPLVEGVERRSRGAPVRGGPLGGRGGHDHRGGLQGEGLQEAEDQLLLLQGVRLGDLYLPGQVTQLVDRLLF